jgi:filamentous hemagglutinin family protein
MGGQRANALPQGEAVAHGKANFKRDGGRMEIRASDRAVINFRGFNIDRNEAVTFVQPRSKSRVLNRVTDGNPTQIFGQLKANGRVMLVNPSGVFFQNGSMVNVGGIIAAAGNISDADFLAGRNRFTELSGEVSNAGTIRATGDVSLVGAHVSNSGIIESGRGMVSLMAGDEVLVGERGGNVYVGGATTPGKAARAGVSNTGKIVAKKALLGAGDFYATAVQHSGKIRAEDVAVRGGKGGRVEVSGKIDVASRGTGKKGGRIEVTGETVALTGAALDASGARGGGEVLVGGDWQGGGTVSRAQTTTVDAATLIQADAVKHGAGGKVVVWADGATQFDGRISARGMGAGQAGGQVETSGRLTLGVGATARVDAGSTGGTVGDWLLDPTNLTIAAGGGGTIGGAGNQTVDASVINNALATVTLTATNDITFSQPVVMTAAGAGLTARAGRNLLVGENVTIATNNGAINFTADSDKNGTGELRLATGSKLTSKGAAVNLTVDHGASVVPVVGQGGLTVLGDIDTRAAATGVGGTSKLYLLGANHNEVLTVGRVSLLAGQLSSGAFGSFELYGDEIDFVGGPGSVSVTGRLTLAAANDSTPVLVGSSAAATPKNLDISRADLAAISDANGFFSFASLHLGRRYGVGGLSTTGQLTIGDVGGAELLLGHSVSFAAGSLPTLVFNSGSKGIVSNVPIRVVGSARTAKVEFYGDVIKVDALTVGSETGVVLYPSSRIPVEILDMSKPGQGVAAGVLRLDTKMVKRIAEMTRAEVQIGNPGTERTQGIALKDPLEIDGAMGGNLVLAAGGTLVFESVFNVGAKNVQVAAGGMEFPGAIGGVPVVSLIRSAGGLSIRPSGYTVNTGSTTDIEIYASTAPKPTGDVFAIKDTDLKSLAGQFGGSLVLGGEANTIGGSIRVNAELDLTGTTIASLELRVPNKVEINGAIKLGAVGGSTRKQNLVLCGREIDLTAGVSGEGILTIQPVNNVHQDRDKVTYPGGNPMSRGMVLGVSGQDPARLTITGAEYANIGGAFSEIVFGRDGMLGDLELANSAVGLKANTRLEASSAIKLHSKVDGGGLYSLWARGLEVDVDNRLDSAPRSLTNLTGFFVNTLPSGQVAGRKIVVNGGADTGAMNLDLTKADLSWIDGASVGQVVVGYDIYSHNHATTPTSNLPIEVEGDWTLTANTELRSANRIYPAGDTTSSQVYGSIVVGGKVDGAGYDLALRSDSRLLLAGGAGSVANVRALSIAQNKLDVPIRLLEEDSFVNPDALVLTKSSYAALGTGIGSVSVGRADSKSDLTVSGALTLVADTTLTTGNYVYNPDVPSQLAGTGQSLSILGAVDGNKSLTLNSHGVTTLTGPVGANVALAALTISKQAEVSGVIQKTVLGAVGYGPMSVRTTGDQFYGEAVDLINGGTLEVGGTLSVAETMAAGAHDLSLFANEMVLTGGPGSITGSRALALGAGTAGTEMAFYSDDNADAPGRLDLSRQDAGAIGLAGFSRLTLGRADGTGALSVNGDFVLLQETLIQTGGGALNIARRIDGAQKLTLSSGAGAITVSGALGGTAELGDLRVLSTGTAAFQSGVNAASVFTDGGGTTVFNGAAVNTRGAQDYNDQVVLGADARLGSLATGDIRLNAGAAGAFALRVETAGETRFAGGLSVGEVSTDTGGSTEVTGNVTTSGGQTYGDAVRVVGPVNLASTGGGTLSLQAGVDGVGSVAMTTSGNVNVTEDSGAGGALQTFSATGTRVAVGSVNASADLTLEASDLIVLQGSSYRAGNQIFLSPADRAMPSGRSSIVGPSGDVSFESQKFVMGSGHKLAVSNGTLSIKADTGTVGDLAASVAMTLDVDNLLLLAREAGPFTNSGLRDRGLSMVSPKITVNGTLGYSPNATGAARVFWNTRSGVLEGTHNGRQLPGFEVAKNPAIGRQFNSVDPDGYILQPLAVKPAVVAQPEVVEPAAPGPRPTTPATDATAAFRITQFDLMNWSLGYRDETMERPDGIWVIRSLGINGRWDNLREVIGTRSGRRNFLEL